MSIFDKKEDYLEKRMKACARGDFNSRRTIYLFYTNEIGLSAKEAEEQTNIECFNLQIQDKKPSKSVEEWIDYGIKMYNKHPKIIEGVLGGLVGGITTLAGAKAAKNKNKHDDADIEEEIETLNIDDYEQAENDEGESAN